MDYCLADRQPEFKAFLDMITGRSIKRIMLIAGPSDRGKSVLLAEFARVARGLTGVRCAQAEFKNGPALREVLWELSRELAPIRFARFERELNRNAEDTLRVAFLDDLGECHAPVLLVLDTYEQATDETKRWVEQRFLPHVRRCSGLCVVLSGQKVPEPHPSAPWEQLATHYELGPIVEAAYWQDYGQRVVGLTSIRPDQIELLVAAVNGSPRALKGMLSNLKSMRT